MPTIEAAVQASRDALAGVTAPAASITALGDVELLSLHRDLSAARRILDSFTALTAGEIAARSTRELGYAGLAQSNGFRTPELLVQSVSGSTRAEAAKLVRVGSMMTDSAAPHSGAPAWQQPLAIALAAGSLSIDAADAIRRGLGDTDAAITEGDLRAAATRLIVASLTIDADALYRRAREERDDLDEAGIARREKQQRDLRYFRVFRRVDGMVAGSFLLDAEDGTTVMSAIDSVLSPRRGGPRFTDPAEAARAERLIADERTNDQLAADAVIGMLRLAIDADPGTFFGRRRPGVRVVVTEESISRRGHGHLEGTGSSVSFPTVERHLCDTGVLGIRFDDKTQVINLGREKRLFSDGQRIGMAARDGGCRYPDCDRPPSHCEAHHINEWQRDHGKTDIADGTNRKYTPRYGLSVSSVLSRARGYCSLRARCGARTNRARSDALSNGRGRTSRRPSRKVFA